MSDGAIGAGAFFTDPLLLADAQRHRIEAARDRLESACLSLLQSRSHLGLMSVLSATKELQQARSGVLPDDIEAVEE